MPAHEEPPVLPGGSSLYKEKHMFDAWFVKADMELQKSLGILLQDLTKYVNHDILILHK